MRSCVWVLVCAVAIRLIAGPTSPACISCCPDSSGAGPTLSNPGCCDDSCGKTSVRNETRPCLASAQRLAAVWTEGILPSPAADAPFAAVITMSQTPSRPSESPPNPPIAPLRI